jgi:hypothetical protein
VFHSSAGTSDMHRAMSRGGVWRRLNSALRHVGSNVRCARKRTIQAASLFDHPRRNSDTGSYLASFLYWIKFVRTAKYKIKTQPIAIILTRSQFSPTLAHFHKAYVPSFFPSKDVHHPWLSPIEHFYCAHSAGYGLLRKGASELWSRVLRVVVASSIKDC